MGKSQRTKGATYEREVAHALTEALNIPGYAVKRNIGQARDGGNDLDVGPLVVECKRRKTLTTIESWLKQATAAASDRMKRNGGAYGVDHIPVVVAREDEGTSLVILDLRDFLTLTTPALRAAIEGAR